MPILHQIPTSGNCYKVRLAAHVLGIPLTLKNYPSQQHGGTRTPEFLKTNPNGKVPVLELDDGRRLPESGAILFYLSEGTRLQPKDRWGRAEMLEWMFFEQYSHEPNIAVARYLKRFAPPARREAMAGRLPELMEKGNAALAVMEGRLAACDWFAGGAFSVADIALYAYTHLAEEGGFRLSDYPHIRRWLDRVAAEPGYFPIIG